MAFEPNSPDHHFERLEKALEGETDAQKAKYLKDFGQHYTDVARFQPLKAKFENTTLFSRAVNILLTTRPPVLADVLRIIMVFSRAEINHKHISKINGVELLVKAMQSFSTDLEVQEQGCRALINIATNDKNRKLLAKEGGVEVLLESLKNGAPSPQLLVAACWALRNVSVDDGNKKLICLKGGPELIVKTMLSNPYNLQLQTQASWALENISIKEDFREKVLGAGAVEAVLLAMKNFPSEKKLQEATTWALSNLSGIGKARELIRKESGIELLMAAAKSFPEEEGIQKHVAEVVGAMTDEATESEEEDSPTTKSTAPKVDDKSKPQSLVVIRKGFLTKQGGRIKTWKKRWFVLDSSKLTYFRGSEEQLSPLGTINLQICQGVLEDTSKKNSFMVVTKNRTYKIVAPSRHEMAEWVVSINQVILELTTSQRPRSIEGGLLKMDEKMLAAISDNPTSPPPEPGATSSTPLSPSMSFGLDLFCPEDRTPAFEVEAVVLNLSRKAISKSPAFQKISDTPNPEALGSYLARHLTDEILQHRLDETYTKNLRGERTNFVDAIKIEKIINQIVDATVEEVLQKEEVVKRLGQLEKRFSCYAHGEQGIRKTMEDYHVSFPYLNELMGKEDPSYSLFAIYDGHGGTRAAEYVSIHLHRNIMNEISQNSEAIPGLEEIAPEEKEDHRLQHLLKKAFVKTNENFFEYLNRQGVADACGSTAVVAFAKDNSLFVCWAGDSEAALFKKNSEDIVLCKTHKASSETEKERIKELGGFVEDINGVARLNGILAVTRSFGDARFKRFVTAEPEIVKHTIDGTEDFLLLACDGLWDVMNSKDIGEFVRHYRDTRGIDGLAAALANRALELHSSDNVSVAVIFFSQNGKP